MEALDRTYLVTVAPITNSQGEMTKAVHICKDITDRKKAEDTLKERVDDLEKFYKLTVNREIRMKQLKETILELKEELSKHKK